MTIQDVFAIQSYHGYMFQILLAEALFLPLLLRRDKFWLRALIGIPVYAVVSWILANLLQFVFPPLTSFSIFLLSFALGVVLFKSSIRTLIFCYAGAMLIQNLAHNIEGVIYIPLAEHFNLVGQFFLSFGVMILVYVAAYFIIINRMMGDIESIVPTTGALFLSIFSAVFCYLVQTLLKNLMPDAHWIVTLPLILCDVVTLLFAFVFVSYLAKQKENWELERLVAQSDSYYAAVGANIEAINMKVHDLKHFVDGASIEQDGLAELKKVVDDYESTAKTGNKALDNVLTNYILLCRRKNIPFTFSVDSESLSFMKPGDLASTFGNLLSNALEAEEKLEDKGKAYIAFKVVRKGEMVSAHIENYWPESINFVRGLPLSTKGDALNHGYGTKSVSYVVKKYGGTISFSHENAVFEANALFPKQD